MSDSDRSIWLSKDERRLLAGYYTNFQTFESEKVYRYSSLSELLRPAGYRKLIPEYSDSVDHDSCAHDVAVLERQIARYVRDTVRIELANKILSERGLIRQTRHQFEINVIVVELTFPGFELGRQYASFWGRSELFFRAYKNHWLLLICAAVGAAAIKIGEAASSWAIKMWMGL